MQILSSVVRFGLSLVFLGAAASAQTMTWTVHAGDYRFVPHDGGLRIEMDGFGQLQEPGAPLVPSKRVLLALPPGARATSVEVTALESEVLPGVYRLAAASQALPVLEPTADRKRLRRLQEEWRANFAARYASDRAFPAAPGELVGTGAMREYAYASVAVRPFTYHARSGRLVHHGSLQITVHYDTPAPDSAAGRHVRTVRPAPWNDARAAAQFANREDLRSLYAPAAGGWIPPVRWNWDYLIITHDTLLDAIDASGFVAWKESLGHHVRTVSVLDPLIANQAGPSRVHKIRQFLRQVYGRWGVQYVLLVGGTDRVPMRYCFPDFTDHTNDWQNPNTWTGEVPTDHYFADLSDPETVSWDTDGDGYAGEFGHDLPDLCPEVYVGRIPTSDAERVTYALEKSIAFEQDTGAWKDNALHGGAILFFENQDHGGLPFIDGCRALAEVENQLMSGWAIDHYSEQVGLQTSTYPWPALNRTVFQVAWRNGQYGVVNWSGHGSCHGAWRSIWNWDDGDGVPETDGSDGFTWSSFVDHQSSLDDDHPSIVFGISCLVGYPEANSVGQLGVDLMTRPGFGAAAAVVSASRPAAITKDWPVVPGGAESFCLEFNRHHIAYGKTMGEAMYDMKWDCHQNCPFANWYEFMNQWDVNLYGDPAMRR